MIRQATPQDTETLAGLALLLWEEYSAAELTTEFLCLLNSREAACFLAIEDGEAVGFAQCQLRRDYVEGTRTSPVGYLEGIFVKPEFRHRGQAKRLLDACEHWAAGQGCREFASDCALSNDDSLRFHLQMGFAEANRIICFTKNLQKEDPE